MSNIITDGYLSKESIDEISEIVVKTLENLGESANDIIKIRLSVEAALDIWENKLGEHIQYQLLKRNLFGKTILSICVNGPSIDPTLYRDDLLLSVCGNMNMISVLGLPIEYRYEGGKNVLLIHASRKSNSSIKSLLITIPTAIIIGLCVRWVAPNFANDFSTQIVEPMMNAFINLLNLVAGPLVFLSIIVGIIGIGDISSFGKIGGILVKRFIAMLFVSSALIYTYLYVFFPITSHDKIDSLGYSFDFFQVLFDIIPKDIVTPFQTGNAIQIIFMATCIGLVCISLGNAVSNIGNNINQLNIIVQKLMMSLSKILPVFVFLCLLDLMMSSNLNVLSIIIVPILVISINNAIFPFLYCIYSSVAVHLPLKFVIKNMLPTYLIAFTTASSAASFSTNVNGCKDKFKIDAKLVNFGVPFGQALFKIGTLSNYIIISLFLSEYYKVEISLSWIMMMLIVSVILAIVSPPIPGGAITSVLVLLSQLGIPESSMAICATIMTFADYSVTACNISCLQQELLIIAKKLNMIKLQT